MKKYLGVQMAVCLFIVLAADVPATTTPSVTEIESVPEQASQVSDTPSAFESFLARVAAESQIPRYFQITSSRQHEGFIPFVYTQTHND